VLQVWHRGLAKIPSLQKLDLCSNVLGEADKVDFTASFTGISQSQSLQMLKLSWNNLSKSQKTIFINTLRTNFSICDVYGIRVPKEILSRNRALRDAHQAAVQAIEQSELPMGFNEEEMEVAREPGTLNLTPDEVPAKLQAEKCIAELAKAIPLVKAGIAEISSENSPSANGVRKKLQTALDNCYLRRAEIYRDAGKINAAIGCWRAVSKVCPQFDDGVRFQTLEGIYMKSLFQADPEVDLPEFSKPEDTEEKRERTIISKSLPTEEVRQAFCQALLVCVTADGTLLTLFGDEQHQKVFDSVLLEASGQLSPIPAPNRKYFPAKNEIIYCAKRYCATSVKTCYHGK